MSKPGKQGYQEPSEWSGSIQERLVIAEEPNIPILERIHYSADRPFSFPAEPVQAPDHKYVELALPGVFQHGLELRPCRLAEGRFLHDVDLDDLPTTLLAYRFQIATL